VITHPEMLTVARLLLGSHSNPGIRPASVSGQLGFPYPDQPHLLEPLRNFLSI
jgi:hypothetical protein